MDPFVVTIGIVFIIAVVFIARDVVAWYNKVNQRIKLLERNNILLERLLASQNIPLADFGEKTITVKFKNSGEVLTINEERWKDFKTKYGDNAFEIINKNF